MKKVSVLFFAVFIVTTFTSCLSMIGALFGKNDSNVSTNPTAQSTVAQKPKGETQIEKFGRLVTADIERIQVVDGKADTASIEGVLKPQVIASIGEITDAKLVDYGKPYYFKIRALYKGYDAEAERASLQDIGEVKSSTLGSALETVFGGDSNIHSTMYFDAVIPTFPQEVNTIATFYLIAAKFSEDKNGNTTNQESGIWVRFIRDVGKPLFNASKFIVANDMHFVTLKDAHVPTQQDAMMAMMGFGSMNSSSSVFDPAIYPATDLLDARVAMDKKKYSNDYTFPTVRVKYVSEVVFKGQSGTTITVSTPDGVSTERMNFGGRATSVANGAKIRIYYTIAKDPLEIWEIQAIEKL